MLGRFPHRCMTCLRPVPTPRLPPIFSSSFKRNGCFVSCKISSMTCRFSSRLMPLRRLLIATVRQAGSEVAGRAGGVDGRQQREGGEGMRRPHEFSKVESPTALPTLDTARTRRGHSEAHQCGNRAGHSRSQTHNVRVTHACLRRTLPGEEKKAPFQHAGCD